MLPDFAASQIDFPATLITTNEGGNDVVLILKTGSRELRFWLYNRDLEQPVLSGCITDLRTRELMLQIDGEDSAATPLQLPKRSSQTEPLDLAMAGLRQCLPDQLQLKAIAHCIAHGGESFVEPVVLDDDALGELGRLASLAPMHQANNLAGVRAAQRQWPELPQVGCFDTAFHATLPELERRLPLPALLDDQGVRRYGFHGLSYEHMVLRLQQETPLACGRALLVHLGAGASLCTTAGGRSVGTSMGFSELDSLMTGTRCGSLDAGIVLHMVRQGWTVEQIEQLLYQESGLLGVSGLSADLGILRASPVSEARLAVDLFVHLGVKEAGGLITALGGIDVLAFSGTQGVRDAELREAWCQRLGLFGVRIDPEANLLPCGNDPLPIHASDSAVEVWVVPNDEGRTAALAAWENLSSQQHFDDEAQDEDDEGDNDNDEEEVAVVPNNAAGARFGRAAGSPASPLNALASLMPIGGVAHQCS